MNDEEALKQMMEDLGVDDYKTGRYPSWLIEMAERLISAGWQHNPKL